MMDKFPREEMVRFMQMLHQFPSYFTPEQVEAVMSELGFKHKGADIPAHIGTFIGLIRVWDFGGDRWEDDWREEPIRWQNDKWLCIGRHGAKVEVLYWRYPSIIRDEEPLYALEFVVGAKASVRDLAESNPHPEGHHQWFAWLAGWKYGAALEGEFATPSRLEINRCISNLMKGE
jgi:hypothetical protein